jgi:hypothetical protein
MCFCHPHRIPWNLSSLIQGAIEEGTQNRFSTRQAVRYSGYCYQYTLKALRAWEYEGYVYNIDRWYFLPYVQYDFKLTEKALSLARCNGWLKTEQEQCIEALYR